MGLSTVVKLSGYANALEALNQVRVAFGEDAVYVCGTDVEYAVFVEEGTSKMAAQPYLGPAARHAQRRVPLHAKRADSTAELTKAVAEDVRDYAVDAVPVDTGRLRDSIEVKRVE